MLILNMRKLILLFLASFLTPTISYAWEEVDCSSIKYEIDIIHSHYQPEGCWRSLGGGVNAYSVDFYDGRDYVWFDLQKITDSNSIWANDYAYQNIKKDNIEDLISRLSLGSNPNVESKSGSIKSSNNRIHYYYRSFETSDGKGVFGGNTINKLFYTFGFFTEDKSADLSEDFLSEILSSLKIPGVNQGQQSSIILSGTSSSGSSIQDVTDALVEQGTGNFGEDVTVTIPSNNDSQSYSGERSFMVNWENIGVMQGTLSYNEQGRTGRIDFKLPNDNSTCFGTYALSEANGSWSFLCSNDSSATGSLQWDSSNGSVVGNGKDNKNNEVQIMVAGR